MSHQHDHGAHGEHDSQRRLGWAILLTGSFMVAELVGGVLSGSLALLADAGTCSPMPERWRWPCSPPGSVGVRPIRGAVMGIIAFRCWRPSSMA